VVAEQAVLPHQRRAGHTLEMVAAMVVQALLLQLPEAAVVLADMPGMGAQDLLTPALLMLVRAVVVVAVLVVMTPESPPQIPNFMLAVAVAVLVFLAKVLVAQQALLALPQAVVVVAQEALGLMVLKAGVLE